MASIKVDTLWVPEKPKVAKSFVDVLAKIRGASIVNKATSMKDGYYALSSGDVVCSVFGHMLSMVPPSRYLTKEQNNDLMSALPLIPNPFRFEPQPERGKDGKPMMRNGAPVVSARFKVLERLIKQAKRIVNACDIDREGQLIFDELLIYVGRNPYDENVLRASIVNMTPEALEKAASELDPNGSPKWRQRCDAAATRQKMDWLLGMNGSMAYQVVTGIRSMSVGRVQTPVLAMVVKRDLEIENFRPQTYFVPVVIMGDGTSLRWEKRHGSEGQDGFDANGRIVNETLAQSIVDQISKGMPGEVILSQQKEKSEAPPMPFSMGSLQSEASKRYGLTVADVTKAAQNLYEKHKAITYVGTDCRFLPEDLHQAARGVLDQLSVTFKEPVANANVQIKSKAFNSTKVEEHFAIIPTGVMPNLTASEHAERCVFEAISKRYIAQFYPDYRTLTASLAIKFGEDEFRASASEDLDIGWKAVEGQSQKGAAKSKGKTVSGNESQA